MKPGYYNQQIKILYNQNKVNEFRNRIVNLRKNVENKFHLMEEFKNIVFKINTSNNEKIKLANVSNAF